MSSERGRLVPPNLDDRQWKDLVADARGLIPTYASQWTDHNPSDLGMALIELFAYLVEGLTYRLNRVPEKNYIAFLNLLGITRDPQTPARAFLTFTAAPAVPVLVPKGTQAQTRASEADAPIVFETDEDVTVLPTNLKVALQIRSLLSNLYVNVSNRFTQPPAEGSLWNILPGQSVLLCLGFDQKVSQEIRLRVRMSRPAQLDPATLTAQVSTTWVYSTPGIEPNLWTAIPGVIDETQALRQDGVIRFTVPANWDSQIATAWATVTATTAADQVADPCFWIGVRIRNLSTAPVSVGVDFILHNAASSFNALTIPAAEALGTSNGKAFQVFALRNRPLFRRPDTDTPYDHLAVTVGGVPWTQVEELPHGPGDVYRIDPVVGEVRFGNFDPSSLTGHGTIPPVGAAIAASTYRYVAGGINGNVGAGMINQMRTPVAGIVAVNNLFSSYGGSDEEPIEETKRRAPEVLLNRHRAITAEDYEYLAREATTDVAIVRCLEPRMHLADFAGMPKAWRKDDPWTFGALDRASGNVNLIVVPDYGPERQPKPNGDLIREVQRYLDKRRQVASRLIVTGPRYLPIRATVEISVFQRAIDNGLVVSAANVATETYTRVENFLHPVHGGRDGGGWQVGQAVFIADLFKAIAPDENVGFVSNLAVEPLVPLYHAPPLGPGGAWDDARERPFTLALGTPRSAVRLADYELVCSASGPGGHNITTVVVN